MTNYIILLPPSEGKNTGGTQINSESLKNNTFKELNSNIYEINKKLIKAIKNSNSEKELEKLLELKCKNLEIAKNITLNFKNEKTLQAIHRYSGVMFKAINYNSLNNIQKTNFNNSIIFIDGLFGLLTPQDMIPNYKLKITSKINKLNITKYWQENLKSILHNKLKNKLVIDLLPLAQRKVLKHIENDLNIIKINFFEKKNGIIKNSGHASKQLKGEIIKYITNNNEISTNHIKKFTHKQGFKFNKELSSEKEFIFLKNNS